MKEKPINCYNCEWYSDHSICMHPDLAGHRSIIDKITPDCCPFRQLERDAMYGVKGRINATN